MCPDPPRRGKYPSAGQMMVTWKNATPVAMMIAADATLVSTAAPDRPTSKTTAALLGVIRFRLTSSSSGTTRCPVALQRLVVGRPELPEHGVQVGISAAHALWGATIARKSSPLDQRILPAQRVLRHNHHDNRASHENGVLKRLRGTLLPAWP
jgi:hypothetical protein